MNLHNDENGSGDNLRNRIIGLGSSSHHKSYYPELMTRISELERFRALLQETSDAIFLVNRDTWRFTDINRSGIELLGSTRERLLEMDVKKALGPDFTEIFTEQQESGPHQSLQAEIVFRKNVEKDRCLDVTSRIVQTPDGIHQVIIARDVTERKLVEEELEQYQTHLEELVAERNEELIVTNQELTGEIKQRIRTEQVLNFEKERLELILKTIDDAVILTTPGGAITYLNRAARDLLGYSAPLAGDKNLDDLVGMGSDKTMILFSRVISEAVKKNHPVDLADQKLHLRKTGAHRIITGSVSPVLGTEKTEGVVIIIRDITERLRIEQELEKAERIESIGLLAGGIAHDFNNVLTSVIANLGLCGELIRPESPAFCHLEKAEEAIYQARRLTQQLLTFSKGGEPIKECIHIEPLIRETAGFALSGSRSIVEYSFQPGLFPVDIDRTQISQVIQNLVLNADQAMENGGTIRIHTENITVTPENGIFQLKDGDYIRISIQDEGSGIPADILTHIFDPYYSTKDTGTGLGLTTVLFILKKHHGTIEVDSAEKRGTRFTLYLPACAEEVIVSDEPEKPVEKPSATGSVLLMDDEEGILDVISILLRRHGWEVTPVTDGQQAVAAYQESMERGKPYDVIIMDLVIPGRMGGKDAIAEILKINPDVFAIVSSGYSKDPVMAEPEKYGFSRVLPKPYKIQDLLNLMKPT